MTLPEAIDDFLKRPNPAVIGCVRPDGYPMTVATWYDWHGGRILVNMSAHRSRLAWMRLNPRVSVTVFDDWYRHVSMFGEVVELRDDDDLVDIDRLARRYTGEPFRNRSDPRVSAWIEPIGWHVWDPSGELARRDPG
ncbi:MAG TPA: pyridoxamine 5'-phosphate oxidase family protein [Candidatus Dormibacteraeota bacterium]|nr:pyridoxamine 5'-phosphate oxidase family protein [Candidatus Dormibacteraeota bacterium]